MLPEHIKNWTLSKKVARIIYEVPSYTHAEPLLVLLYLDSLSNRRREDHFIRLINTFISGKCHQSMTSFVTLLPDNSLDIQSSRF